jgi:hypothetical protein
MVKDGEVAGRKRDDGDDDENAHDEHREPHQLITPANQ